MSISGTGFRDQTEFLAGLALYKLAVNRSKPHLWTTQVLQNRYVTARLPAHFPYVCERLRVLVMRSVRKVESKHIDSSFNELSQDLRCPGSGTDCRNDFGSVGR
jgi:hypothetical protein